ncbi:MAG: hypothetical protein IT331_07380 [Anaerolineae bacterium]|nr:hypothetical protein [Anaerolineae bacterium]
MNESLLSGVFLTVASLVGLLVLVVIVPQWEQVRNWARSLAGETGGYVHDTGASQWIDPALIAKSAGTWTPTYSTNKIFHRRTAGDATFNLFIPVVVKSNSSSQKGAYLKSIDVFYNVTNALDDLATVELNKQSLSSVGAHTAGAVTTTLDSGHDSAAERKAAGEHKMTVTLATPAWVDDDESYVLYMVCDAAATSVFDLVGARANYTLRV